MLYLRIISDFFLIALLFFFPFWVPLFFGILFLFYFRNFYEYVIMMFLYDILYGGGGIHLWGIPFILSITSMIIYLAVLLLRDRLILYTK